jgi:hypothetical protein
MFTASKRCQSHPFAAIISHQIITTHSHTSFLVASLPSQGIDVVCAHAILILVVRNIASPRPKK